MRQADEIRQYAVEHYVDPARIRGEKRVTIRAGNVRIEKELPSDSVAAVGGALDTEVFEKLANVKRVDYHGVPSRRGADANFEFEILPVLKNESREADFSESWREHVMELAPNEFQDLVREYLKSKGFTDAEIEIVIRMKG